MKITELLQSDTITMNLAASSKEGVLEELIDSLDRGGYLIDREQMKMAILAREAQSTTGIGEGIAIPHAKTTAVKEPRIAFGRSTSGVDYQSLDGEAAHLFFMIAVPEGSNNTHLDALARLSMLLMDETLRQQIMQATTEAEILSLIDERENAEAGAKNSETSETVEHSKQNLIKILAVTACPTGIAHTYMAADSLKKTAEALGYDIKVETNGSGGVKNQLTSQEIAEATAIVVAADKQVEMDRFAGKVVIEAPVAEGIRNPKDLLTRAAERRGPVYGGQSGAASYTGNIAEAKAELKKKQPAFYKHLMNGVSNMLPLVVGGGIIIAISFMFGIKSADPKDPSFFPFAKHLMDIGGGTAFALMVAVLSGYIAMSIADRPGLAPGLVGGMLASTSGAGFLGGLIAGFFAGYVVVGLKKLFARMPQSLEGIKPMLLYPLLGILITGLGMVYVISPPVTFINNALAEWLRNMGTGNAVLLGIILGAMMAFDMGGPVNKAAFTFGIAMIANHNYLPHAAIMAAGMTPPLGLALATTLFKSKFTRQEREAGKTAYVLGATFITEGAIPFAAADPSRVIPATMLGSAVAGGLSMFFKCTLPAPHGGIFVIPVVGNIPGYIISIVVGTLVTALTVNFLKKKVVE
ncbi:fructose-specific PTS transporter subunit EIIC [Aneurinibacillus sp. Ricciae_BoGa-3]|uniref:PTS fructose transporter subunit IIABC n=1 Tax=Aneurinibacillus sp. Ricciae_BoGa-3 TaxID=3022697 RepID=UPI0023418E34|nr:PTS fructose transporter subunit IIABC [Aneurinibacillus sp. Ricciae_BoGa-3]WCK55280.1 fructose-specific PTS transporter subunit EIIC [Aneurinibacillus sp. Ricciae_BoGa-3]